MFTHQIKAMDTQEIYQQIKDRRRYPNLPVNHWKRQPLEIWKHTRAAVWKKSGGMCESPENGKPKKTGVCMREVPYDKAHIDHIRPISSGGSNHVSNLRTLCPVCHALREDRKHKSMRDKMNKNGLLPDNFADLIWN
ncbi:HNH endonuclease [Synechocystis sp. FACHB-383]|uniref:HNH endonuclease n=1 Tax=Synechocystis sp. FACHB-383 TaxID=2692864 RepID=UPI0018EF5B83|nr:HNH endonuclease [Synechocystis sp. FACHB-383]